VTNEQRSDAMLFRVGDEPRHRAHQLESRRNARHVRRPRIRLAGNDRLDALAQRQLDEKEPLAALQHLVVLALKNRQRDVHRLAIGRRHITRRRGQRPALPCADQLDERGDEPAPAVPMMLIFVGEPDVVLAQRRAIEIRERVRNALRLDGRLVHDL
jgi:hypothetical protein